MFKYLNMLYNKIFLDNWYYSNNSCKLFLSVNATKPTCIKIQNKTHTKISNIVKIAPLITITYFPF